MKHFIGFNFTQNAFWYCVTSYEEGSSQVVESKKTLIPDKECSELMDWFETNFHQIFEKFSISKAGFNVAIPTTHIQIDRATYPKAILNLICFKRNIEIEGFSTTRISLRNLKVKSELELYTYLDNTYGKHSPAWNNNAREALGVALLIIS